MSTAMWSTPPPGALAPCHALDRALRRALTRWYPELEQMHLIDYKVRVPFPHPDEHSGGGG